MPSTLRQIKIQDATDPTLVAGVNSNQEVKVHDAELLTVGVAGLTLQATANTTLSSIEEATEAIEVSGDESNRLLRNLLKEMIQQQKITNLYLANMNGEGEYTTKDAED